MKLFTTRCLIFVLLLCSTKLSAQTFSGSNPPDTFQDFAFTIGSSSSNLSIVVPGSTNNFSHLLLKKGAAPSVDNYDFIALGNGQTNFINLQAPEFSATNYVLRVYTPTNSLSHDFTVTITTNLNDFRGFNRPATKALETQVTGTITSNSWQYFRIDVPTNLPGWRVVLYTTNLVTPDLYVQTNLPPASTNYWKRSTALNPDTLTFTNNEAGPGPHFVGVFLPGTTNIVNYTLTVELSSIIDLTWDPGLTHLGNQVYLNTNQTGGDYYFRIVAENTALGAWRTALNVLSGEAQVYMLRGALPAPTTATYKSERVGSDGFVIPASAFKAGEEWFLMIRAQPGSEWNLVTGEPFVLDLGTLTANGSSGSSNVVVGAEGMRFFKTTVPLDTLAWRLWLNGLTNSLLVKKGGVPVTGATDLSQNGQMLVVPTYLIGGQLYFVGIAGVPGASVQLDSRQHNATDINFQSISSLSVTGFPYASFRAQVPIDQLAWQISVIVSNGNPNVAVRRNFIPNEFNNDAYSEVPGAVTDSISLVPSTLSDGTFYITVYGTNNHGFGLQTGPPVVTDINFSSSTLNDDPNRAGWRYFRVTDVVAQLGALGWDLFLSNSVPGTRIGLRRNAVPSLWNRRNNGVNSTAGSYDVLSVSDFLQRPAHQADVWYVGVYNTNAALGAFTLITQPLVAETVGFANDARSRMNVPTGKWQFFHYVVPSNTFGWDLRFTEVSNGSPRIVVRRDQLPTAWTNLTAANNPWSTPGSSTTFPSGNQWRADRDWTRLAQSPDGLDEIGRVHAMGMGLPLEPGTYYVGVIDVAGSNSMSYTLTSRGIGPGYPIPIADLNYSGGSASGSLPPREAAYYRVVVPTNVPSWKIKLDATSGDVLLIVMTNRIPNVDSGRGTTGKLMQKIDNEHYVLLPPDGRTTLVGGTYFLAVVSEGVGSTGARIGSGNATYTLTSEGPLPVQHLGTLTSAGADITQVDSLEGGEVKAYTFTTAADTLAMEIWLEDRVGNPVMVAQFDEELPDPGQMSDVVTADLYGNEGGTSGAAAPDLITCANCEGSFFSLVLKARGSGMVYSNASYTLRIHSVGVNPLPFDGGSASVVAQTWGTFRYWEVVVPPNALGWDVRVKDVTGAGIPHLVIGRGFLPGIWETFFLGLPGNETNWFVGEQWAAASDWTRRQLSATGGNENGRILAMGMGRPLEPGTYIVAVNNDTILGTADSSYTLLSRGIGSGFSIPVVDLDFYSGISSHAGLEPREAAYYRVEIPAGAPSWRVKVSTNVGEAMLVLLSNNVPNVDSGRPSFVGKFMQKSGTEHYVLLPTNGQSQLPGGTYYLAVVSEGTNVTSATRTGVGHTSFTIQSLGPMPVENLGVVAAGNDLLYSVPSQEGGETRGFQFTVPSGISSLQVRLDNRIGNPVMVVRHGPEFPDPSAVGPGFAVDEYGDQGGYQVINTTTNAAAGSSLVTLANPPPGTYSMVVKVRAVSSVYSNASYTVRVSALAFTDLAFDCGTAPITNHLAGTWRYFRIEVPTNALGWDVRLGNVSNGTPRLVVRRDALPSSLGTVGWGQPADNTNWPSGNQWAANADWTARPNSAAAVNENFRILAMGMGQPLEAGTYYVGVNNSGSTTNLSYTITSRGIGAGMCLPVTDLAFNGGTVTNTGMVPREAAYYRIQVPSNSPSLKVRVASTGGELMVLAFTGKIPSVDSGRNNNPGKVMQKAGNEHYVLLPDPGQSVLIPGPVYLAVVSEGVNPASANQVGFGTSSFVITCFGGVPIHNLGTVGPTDLVKVDSLDGGESKAYQFVVPLGVALEARLENRIGNPVMELKNGAQLPDPGQAASGFAQDVYGNEGGQLLATVTTNNITLPSPTNGIYSLVVKARSVAGAYPDAQYTVRVRQVPVIDLNFSDNLNTNGLTNTASGFLADNQRAYFRVIVPSTNNGQAVVGWRLQLAQSSGVAYLRARQNFLPDDAALNQMPFTLATSVLAPPFLTQGTWYVEVRGSNSTSFSLISRAVMPERPVWAMPGIGQPSTTPGLVAPEFGDTGVDTNGVALPGDQGVDLAQGGYHFYAVEVPRTNAGILRVQVTAISGNPDVYIRTNFAPTVTHGVDGKSGTIYDRTLASGVTEYGNFVPLTGRTEFELKPGTWYLAVRAGGNANARYRLAVSVGNVQELSYNGGTANGQIAGSDWQYFRVQFPQNSPTNWYVTFSQLVGDVVMYVRDTVPPGNGTTLAEIKDWNTDNKNVGPYSSFNSPGTYLIATPQLRPGSVYYLGFRAVNDATFTVSNNVAGGLFPLYPTINFYGGSVSNQLPPFSQVTYRIFAPPDATRWKHSATHINSVMLYLENGYLPAKVSDDWRSLSANSTLNQYLLANWPWQPNANYYLTITNTTASAQNYAFVMDGRNALTDDNDSDGMLDVWERIYFGSTTPTAAGDFDGDGVSNLNEYNEGTNPSDPTSLRPRLTVITTNGSVAINPMASNYNYGASVTLTAMPAPGYVFVQWTGHASGTNNPLFLTMTNTRTITAVFRAPGDDFAQRIPLDSGSSTVGGYNTNATKELGEPAHAGNPGARSVWWTWTPLLSGSVTINTHGSSFNTLLAVYTGNSGNSFANLSEVASNDNDGTNNTSRVTFMATGGVPYAIAVDGFGGASGNVTLQVISSVSPIVLGSPVRLPNGTFQFTLTAEAGYDYQIQASTNLVNWETIATLPNPTGTIQFIDPNAANFLLRYYRATRVGSGSGSQWALSNPNRQGVQFVFAVSGPTGQVVRIEAGTNLVNWGTVATMTNSSGTMQYTDPAAGNFDRRFYRAVSP